MKSAGLERNFGYFSTILAFDFSSFVYVCSQYARRSDTTLKNVPMLVFDGDAVVDGFTFDSSLDFFLSFDFHGLVSLNSYALSLKICRFKIGG